MRSFFSFLRGMGLLREAEKGFGDEIPQAGLGGSLTLPAAYRQNAQPLPLYGTAVALQPRPVVLA